MTKRKVSATVSPERIERAQELVQADSVSELLELALDALVERVLEQRWLDAHASRTAEPDLPGETPPDLTDVPWEPRS